MSEDNKYQEYHDYAVKLHDEQKSRYTRLDQKASIYLTSLSALIGAAGFFSNWMIEMLLPITGWLDWIVLLAILILLGSLVYSWISIMRVLRVGSVANLPLTEEAETLFRGNHSKVTRLFALTQTAIKCQNDNIFLNDKKVKYLTFAYRGMWVSLILTILLILTTPFFNNPKIESSSGGFKMTENTNSQNKGSDKKPASAPKPAEPDTSVKPLTPQYLSEGYDPAIGSKTAAEDSTKKK